MRIAPTDSIAGLAFPRAAVVARPAKPSEIECRVIDLFDQFRNPILRYTLSFGLSVQDGEEITQEVFLALFRHLQLRKSRRNLQGWIFRVAHNLALKKRFANHRCGDKTGLDWACAERQSDPSPSQEEHVLSAQRQQRLLAVVQALPEEDQCCLRLRAEGLRYREIAAALGVSLGSVSISLARSLARLARADGR